MEYLPEGTGGKPFHQAAKKITYMTTWSFALPIHEWRKLEFVPAPLYRGNGW
jgi:hypothetical protein